MLEAPVLQGDSPDKPAARDQEVAEAVKSLIQSNDRTLVEKYTRAEKPKSEQITLYDIPDGQREERIQQLHAKLKEYTARLTDVWSTNPYLPPDGIPVEFLYRRDILGLALTYARVNKEALEIAYGNFPGPAAQAEFESSWRTVAGYIRDGGRTLKGGTGLPTIPSET